MLGGHYTYAEVPLGFWVQDALGLARNHYDRLGPLRAGLRAGDPGARDPAAAHAAAAAAAGSFFLVTCVCLAISAPSTSSSSGGRRSLGGEAADAFLGTQGDVWDTQWDMFLALIGAVAAQLALSRVHDRQLAALPA